MNLKEFKHHSIILIFTISVLLIITIGSSYSAFFRLKANENNQSLSTGTNSVSITSTALSVSTLEPMSDSAGLLQNSYATLNVQNTGTFDLSYFLVLHYDNELYLTDGNNKALLPMEYLRLALYDSNDVLISDIIKPENCPVYSYGTSANPINNSVVIYLSSIDTNVTDSYHIKVWVSEDAEDEEYIQGTLAFFKISAETVITDAEAYSLEISGTSGDVFKILNNSSSYTFDNNGSITVENIIPGTYNYLISDSQSVTNNPDYSALITVQYGNSLSLSAASTYTSQTAMNKYELAQSAHTVFSLVNCGSLNSNLASCNSNTVVNPTNSYILTIPESHPIPVPIRISVDANDGHLSLD